jgi:hypothetical protein
MLEGDGLGILSQGEKDGDILSTIINAALMCYSPVRWVADFESYAKYPAEDSKRAD